MAPSYPENAELEAWLAREQPEPVLEPELPIIDAHHHLWDWRQHPAVLARWRQGVYLLPELLSDLGSGHKVVRTVYVQCGAFVNAAAGDMAPLGEVEFVQGVAAMSESGVYGPCRVASGIVGTCDLASPGAELALRAMAGAARNFRGVRTKLGEDSEQWLRGFALLGKLGLSFDIWQRPYQDIPRVTALARRFPNTVIILNHFGGLVGPKMTAEERARWRSDIADIAECPNVVCKLGGAAMQTNGWGLEKRGTPIGSAELCELVLPFFSHALDCFGAGRCMFESNFPVDKDSVSYRTLWNALKRIAAAKSLSPADKAMAFHGTAARVYRLEPPSGAVPPSPAADRPAARL